MSGRPSWVLLVPADPEWVRSNADAVWRERFEDVEDLVEPWVVLPGTGRYTALLDFDPGSAGTEDGLARRWSAELASPVYSLWLGTGPEAARRFERGGPAEWLADDPGELAMRLGVDLGGEAPSQATGVMPATRSVCVAIGAEPEAAARALGFASAPADGPLHIEPGPRGTLVWSEAGSASILFWDLAEALPGPVYLLVTGPDPGRFFCRLAEGGEEIGTFETPWPEHAESARLEEVEGERDPARIAEALGVPSHVLGLSAGP